MILPASKSVTASSSSEKRLPATKAREKLCFACRADNFVNAVCN